MAFPNEPIDHSVTEVAVVVADANEPLPDNTPLPDLTRDGPPPTDMIYFGCVVVYERDHGKALAPKAGLKGTPSAVWRVHGGKCRKIVTWEAGALRGFPTAPSPASFASNDVLIKDRVVASVPVPGVDGKPIYRLVGEYEYELQFSPDDN